MRLYKWMHVVGFCAPMCKENPVQQSCTGNFFLFYLDLTSVTNIPLTFRSVFTLLNIWISLDKFNVDKFKLIRLNVSDTRALWPLL